MKWPTSCPLPGCYWQGTDIGYGIHLAHRHRYGSSQCGSRNGYRLHLKIGTEACRPCKDAHAAAHREYMRTRQVST